jgi:hypothetical protein
VSGRAREFCAQFVHTAIAPQTDIGKPAPTSRSRSYNAGVNDPLASPQDLDVDAAAFWLDTDLEGLLEAVKPYDGPAGFVIDDLTDDEWDRFVAALDE